MIKRVCVYCASSQKIHIDYLDEAKRLGAILAENKIELVYGGGAFGSMGAIANGVLENNGLVTGIMPRFMDKVEWGHKKISNLILVDEMADRKALLIKNIDAVIALPGGSGTLEELSEIISLKRLGKFVKPIVIVNQNGFYDTLINFFNKMVDEKFLKDEHLSMWTVVNSSEECIEAIKSASPWSTDAINSAAV